MYDKANLTKIKKMNELAPEVLGQLVTRDVAKYGKLLEEKK